MTATAIGTLALVAVALAALPALLTTANLRVFSRAPRPQRASSSPRVSILVPARNEAAAIERLVVLHEVAARERGAAAIGGLRRGASRPGEHDAVAIADEPAAGREHRAMDDVLATGSS